MATRIFYNSNTDGTIKDQVASGQLGGFFSTLTVTERLSGDTEFAKIWIESDTTEIVYIGVSKSSYDSYIFLSANEADDETDLLGTEDLFTEYEVISATTSNIVVEGDGNLRADDYMIINNELYQINTVTDLGGGEYQLDFPSVSGAISAGDMASTAFQLSLTAATPKPLWAKEVVPAGSPRYASYTASNLIIGS